MPASPAADGRGPAALSHEEHLNAAQKAIRKVSSPGDLCTESDAIGELIELARTDESVIQMIVEAAVEAPVHAKSDLVLVLQLIWRENDDERARAALYDFLNDPDVDIQVAVALAQRGDTAGADVLRAVGAQNAGSFEDPQREAQEARYWLEQLGLDMTGAPSWTDSVPLDEAGIGVFEGRITRVNTPKWGDGLSQLVVSVSATSEPLVVTVPWNVQVVSRTGESVQCGDFLKAASTSAYQVRVSAEDVARCPWAVKIELLERE